MAVLQRKLFVVKAMELDTLLLPILTKAPNHQIRKEAPGDRRNLGQQLLEPDTKRHCNLEVVFKVVRDDIRKRRVSMAMLVQ